MPFSFPRLGVPLPTAANRSFRSGSLGPSRIKRLLQLAVAVLICSVSLAAAQAPGSMNLWEISHSELRALADKGDGEAQRILGERYMFGRGDTPKDQAQAFVWSQKAADKGNSYAMYNLALLYDWGTVVPKDEAKSIYWLQKAADSGNPDAPLALGLRYEQGNAVPQDKAKAMELYEKAAALGNQMARTEMAKLDPSPIATSYSGLTINQTFNSIYKLNMAQPDINYTVTTTGAGATPAVVRDTFTISPNGFLISTDPADVCTMGISTDGGYRINFRAVSLDSVEILPYFQYLNEKTDLRSPGTDPNFYVLVAEQSFAGAPPNSNWHSWSILGAYLDSPTAEQAAKGWIHIIRLCRASSIAGSSNAATASLDSIEERAFQEMKDKEAGSTTRTDSERAYASSQIAQGDAHRQKLDEEMKAIAQRQAFLNDLDADRKQSTSIKAVDVLNAVNSALSTVNDQMAQANAQQQAQIDANWQKIDAQVAASNTRRVEEARQRANEQADTSGIHPSSGTPALPPTYPSMGTAKPPVPYNPAPSTGGTVVATNGNSNICPADGWIMVTTGDVAVGHQCTPGQPVNTGSNSDSPGSGLSSANSSGSGSGGSGAGSGSGSNSNLISPHCTGVMGKLVQDTNLPNRNDLWFNSLCAEDVSVTWYLGNALGATASIHSFANVPTYSGVYPGESTKLSIYVCPLDHPVPVKTDGNQVDGHDEKFLCSTRLGGGWPPFLPQ